MSDPNETIRALRSTLVSKERELNTLLDRLSEVTGERDRALSENGPSGRQDGGVARTAGVIETDDRVVLQEVGIYTYQHPLENAEQYRDALTKIRDRIKTSVNSRSAIVASDMFSFNNSLAKGRKMTSDLSKLMLRAYNAEADICVRTIKAGNLATAVNRLEKASTTIAKLGSIMQMHVAEKYHALRVAELELTADYMRCAGWAASTSCCTAWASTTAARFSSSPRRSGSVSSGPTCSPHSASRRPRDAIWWRPALAGSSSCPRSPACWHTRTTAPTRRPRAA